MAESECVGVFPLEIVLTDATEIKQVRKLKN